MPSFAVLGVIAAAVAACVLVSTNARPDTTTLCSNIDERLPCSTRVLYTNEEEGPSYGAFMGNAMKAEAIDFYNNIDTCPTYQEIYAISPTFRVFIKDYMEAHAVRFPLEHEELLAMADAIGTSPEMAFIQGICTELQIMLGHPDVVPNPKLQNIPPIYAPGLLAAQDNSSQAKSNSNFRPRGSEHCSDVGLIYRDEEGNMQALQGHNEDWWSTVAGNMAIVQTPTWMGYIYPGELPGTSFSTNIHGVMVSMNSVYPDHPGYHADSVPNHQGVAYSLAYALRAVVKAQNLKEIVTHLTSIPVYAGYSLNVLSACDTSISNIEGYGDHLHIATIDGESDGGTLSHFNAYKYLKVEDSAWMTSSAQRDECLNHMDLLSGGGLRSYLGNLTCPVFMTNIDSVGLSETLGSWIADGKAKECLFYRLPIDCDTSRHFNSRCGTTEPIRVPWNYSCE